MDERLRELERRWKETGAVEDEAEYLRERVRVGELSQGRLELAAHLGHGLSQSLLGQTPKRPELREYWTLFADLPIFGPEAFLRASLGTARLLVDSEHFSLPELIYQALESVEDWLLDPTPERRDRALRLGGEVENLAYDRSRSVEIFAWFASQPCAAIQDWETGGVDSDFFRSGPLPSFNEKDLLRLSAEEYVIPWALGYIAPGKAWTE